MQKTKSKKPSAQKISVKSPARNNLALDASIVLKSLQSEAAPTIRKIQGITIQSQGEFEQAGELLKNVKMLAKAAKDKEDSLTQPLTKVVAGIRDLFRPFRQMVIQVEEQTKARMIAYVEGNKAKTEKAERDFADGKIKKVGTFVSKVNDLVVNNTGSVQVRKVWQAVAVDVSLTPREYLMPDELRIKVALKDGKDVAGWEWKQVETIAV